MSGLADLLMQRDFDTIRQMRDQPRTLEEQRALALAERRAYARETVQHSPIRGSLAMLVAPPLEQAYKGLQHLRGRQVGRSGYFAPLANIGAAYTGMWEGWR